MNINTLVGLHLDNYTTVNRLHPTRFTRLRRQINEGQDLQDRRNFDGHVTSSFALLDPTFEKVLMIHHKAFDKWLFPGGHYEGRVSPRKSALRELEEETGFPINLVSHFDELDYVAIDVDTHEIPARPEKNEDAHWHHDFLYLGKAISVLLPELQAQVEEVHAAKWISLDEAVLLPDERVVRAIGKIIKLVRV